MPDKNSKVYTNEYFDVKCRCCEWATVRMQRRDNTFGECTKCNAPLIRSGSQSIVVKSKSPYMKFWEDV